MSCTLTPRILRKSSINIASPIADSAAATVNVKNTKTCPLMSCKKLEKVTKLKLTASNINSIGYMADEEGYQRFFSYISLFTFMMLMLVLSNNFVQLFFGWEGVGLVSYLLIGFYIKRESAVFANLKAFLINRIGDFGFLLG